MKMIYVYSVLVIMLIVVIVLIKVNTAEAPGQVLKTKFDDFAQCLTDTGAKFFGAYWCPHCQAQKKMLDNSKSIPYIECSTPDGQAQTKICIDAGITGYPTWVFADGSRADGEQTLEELSSKTNCPLPENV